MPSACLQHVTFTSEDSKWQIGYLTAPRKPDEDLAVEPDRDFGDFEGSCFEKLER